LGPAFFLLRIASSAGQFGFRFVTPDRFLSEARTPSAARGLTTQRSAIIIDA
jgi:hypothetical protein